MNSVDRDYPDLYILAKYLVSTGYRSIIVYLKLPRAVYLGEGPSSWKKGTVRTLHDPIYGRTSSTIERIDTTDARLRLLPKDNAEKMVVLCTNLAEQISAKNELLDSLVQIYEEGAIVLLVTPDRARFDVRTTRQSPSHKPTSVWNMDEFKQLLRAAGMPATFIGHTRVKTTDRQKRSIISLHDYQVNCARLQKCSIKNPVAIIATFNDADIINTVADTCLADQIDLVFLDNWSTDETFKILSKIRKANETRVSVERFPVKGAVPEFDLRGILSRKAEIARRFKGRWVCNWDSDEMRESPWSGVNLKEGLNFVENCGCNIIDFTVLNFRPTQDGFDCMADPRSFFDHFEFGDIPALYNQKRAWLQGGETVDLCSSGGHVASFSKMKLFPYKFLIRHYPLRSVAQARNKLFRDRLTRWSHYEKHTLGWHHHYEGVGPESSFVWDPKRLLKFDDNFRDAFLIEAISDAALHRYRKPSRDPRG